MNGNTISIIGAFLVAALGGISAGLASGRIPIGPDWTPIAVILCSLLSALVALLTPKVTLP